MSLYDLKRTDLPPDPEFVLVGPTQRELLVDQLLPPAVRILPVWLKDLEIERREREGLL